MNRPYFPAARFVALLLLTLMIHLPATAQNLRSSPLKPAKDVGPCFQSSETACLQNNRFRVEVEWATQEGGAGQAQRVAHPASTDSTLFWFFDEENWELLIKVLDGCDINDRFWVFAAAGTDVGYTLRVTDTQAAVQQRSYTKAVGVAAPSLTDTLALPTCEPGRLPEIDILIDPAFLDAGASGTLSVEARETDGTPAVGRTVELSAELGTFDTDLLTTDSEGRASTIYHAPPLEGLDRIQARMSAVGDLFTIGELHFSILPKPASISMVVNPSFVPLNEDSNLYFAVLVTDYAGVRITNVPVFLDSPLGTVVDGPTVFTNSNGIAEFRLHIQLEELEGKETGDVFEVTAVVDGLSGPISEAVTISIR